MAQLTRKHGISAATYYHWKSKYAGASVAELKRLRETKRRVPQHERQPLVVEPRMNAVWAIDFMRDTLYSGRVFRPLNVIDEANRGSLGIDRRVHGNGAIAWKERP